MRNKIILWIIIVLVGAAVMIGISQYKAEESKVSGEITKEIKPFTGSLDVYISCTGTVLPKNRLEVKPPVNGRVETILVKEGDHVKVGQVLAWMSSTERAALLDAARGKGEEAYKYWQETYKPISLSAPIEGDVIVGTTQPGQTVTTSDAVVVLSDKLIVRAQVDETDIGKIKLGQKAIVSLDAYPDVKIDARAEHIYYESETVNNVTIYKVDLAIDSAPSFFRSGMNASVDFNITDKENVLLVPIEAIQKENNEDFVLVKEANGAEPVKRIVSLGMTDDKNYEVLSGLGPNDTVIFKTKEYIAPAEVKAGTNPFMPKMPGAKKNSTIK